MLKQNRPDIVQRKKSDAVVVSAVLSDDAPTLTTLIQISLSTCQESGRAYEVRGGALREVSLFGRFPAYPNVS